MGQIDNDRRKHIYETISIIKIISLFLCSTVLLKESVNYKKIFTNMENDYFNMFCVGAAVCIVTILYIIWDGWLKKMNNKIIKDGIFMVAFLILIIISGANISQYKFLFLFVIIISTIETGKKAGLIIAASSSSILLAMDLICVPHTEVNQYFENDLVLSVTFLLTAWILGHYVKIEEEYIAKLATLANVDGLTGIYNHRFFYETIKRYIEIAEEFNSSVSLIMMDIDYFKYYNDSYGHQKGDEVLRQMGQILLKSTRDTDVVSRYGGEEFTVILPNTDEASAVIIAEKIRSAVELHKFEGENNQPNGKITISAGIATFPYKARNDMELISNADDALYRAKFLNKNRVEIYHSIVEELKNEIEEEHIDLITSIKTLISAINARDKYTYGHVERVVILCKFLGDALELTEEEKRILRYGAYMHDIGKIDVSREILNKKIPLSEEEWLTLKQHPSNGVEILKSVTSLEKVLPLVLYHHEKYDGSGYPYKLKGENIPYLARILSVANGFDGMTSKSPYGKGLSFEESIEELKKYSGIRFDPQVVKVFTEMVKINKSKICMINS